MNFSEPIALGISLNSLIIWLLIDVIISPFWISLLNAAELSNTLPIIGAKFTIPKKKSTKNKSH